LGHVNDSLPKYLPLNIIFNPFAFTLVVEGR
jgi:hypothetical protein